MIVRIKKENEDRRGHFDPVKAMPQQRVNTLTVALISIKICFK